MSADTPSVPQPQTDDTDTKYTLSSRDRWALAADVPISDYALERYCERTPEDCEVPPATAWSRGADLKHPEVLRLDSEKSTPTRGRLYKQNVVWFFFLFVVEGAGVCVARVYTGLTHEHTPTKSYLWNRPPHNDTTETVGEEGGRL
jgi:hypothetical protein